MGAALASYVRAQLMGCLVVGTASAIGLTIIGVPYALALAILAGLLEFIPLVGPLVAAGVAIIIAGFHSLGEAVAVLVFLLIIRGLEDYVVFPRLVGRGLHLHPLAVVLAVLCGAKLAGVAGV